MGLFLVASDLYSIFFYNGTNVMIRFLVICETLGLLTALFSVFTDLIEAWTLHTHTDREAATIYVTERSSSC